MQWHQLQGNGSGGRCSDVCRDPGGGYDNGTTAAAFLLLSRFISTTLNKLN